MANVRKRGNKYTITVNYGVDIAGKQLRKYVTFAPDPKMTPKQQKKALEKFVVEFEEKVKNGEVLDGKTISLIDFYYKWLEEYVKISLEPTTVQWYQSLFEKKILPALGHLKMSEIKPFNLQTFYNSLSKEGARDDGGAYSPTSVKKYHAALSSLLNKAVEWEVIASNPAKKTSLPKQKGVGDSVHCFTPEQAITFLNALNYTYTTHIRGIRELTIQASPIP